MEETPSLIAQCVDLMNQQKKDDMDMFLSKYKKVIDNSLLDHYFPKPWRSSVIKENKCFGEIEDVHFSLKHLKMLYLYLKSENFEVNLIHKERNSYVVARLPRHML